MSSAVRCSCEAFYDEEVLANHFDKILPYLCFEFLVFRDMESDDSDKESLPETNDQDEFLRTCYGF